jgi:hypothetical protein
MARVLAVVALIASIFASPAPAQDILIELDRFGVGSTYRPGGWVAARFRVTQRGGEPQAVQLVWETPNADGDIAEHTRSLVLNPGTPTVRWLSAWLLPGVDPTTTFAVRLHAEDAGQRGRELTATRVSPASAAVAGVQLDLSQSLIGVFGVSRLNLDGYSTPFGMQQLPRGMHETTRIIAGLDAKEIPDRWEGLGAFEALIWTDASPAALELEEAESLRQYIARGGHLVIVLPQAGNPWNFGSSAGSALGDLLPSTPPQRLEGVPIDRLTPLLSKIDGVRNPRAITSLSVWDPEALDPGWVPFLALPARRDPTTGALLLEPGQLDGRCVAIQRLVQHGRITILGIDVAAISRLGLQAGGLPQPDAFWNQILGRRGDAPTGEELDILDKATPRRLTPDNAARFTMGGGELIASRIGMTGPAMTGTLLAIVVFAVYWLIAGPLGFILLKRAGKVRHTWLAFLVTGLVFTAVAWVGGAAIRLGNVRLQHVTVLDHVARVPGDPPRTDPQYQRAISWMSIYLPGYGSTRVEILSDPGQRDLLASWLAPGTTAQRFPNIDRYVVPYSSPNAFDLPSRATATLLEARWMGTIDQDVGRLPYASDPAQPIREVITRTPSLTASLEGRLRHELRGTLSHVSVLHISSLRTPLRRMLAVRGLSSAQPALPGELPAIGLYFYKASWAPGEELDLSQMYVADRTGQPAPLRAEDARSPRSLARSFLKRYREDIAAETSALGLGSPSIALTGRNWARLIEMLSFFNMLPTPVWFSEGALLDAVPPRYLRQLGRELDLSAWFTRPCLIIIGLLEEEQPDGSTPCPVPMVVDGVRPPASGSTVVRWICPLPVASDLVSVEPRRAVTEELPESGGSNGATDAPTSSDEEPQESR